MPFEKDPVHWSLLNTGKNNNGCQQQRLHRNWKFMLGLSQNSTDEFENSFMIQHDFLCAEVHYWYLFNGSRLKHEELWPLKKFAPGDLFEALKSVNYFVKLAQLNDVCGPHQSALFNFTERNKCKYLWRRNDQIDFVSIGNVKASQRDLSARFGSVLRSGLSFSVNAIRRV